MTTHAGFAATSSGCCAPPPEAQVLEAQALEAQVPDAAPAGRATPTVTVVICAYTELRWPEIVRAVGSVLAQQAPAGQVLLVVDHDEALLRRARDAMGEGVTVLANTGPRGLSGARNTGVAHARGEVVAFLDDDAAAEPGWLAGLLRHYADPRVLGAGGRAVPAWDGVRPRWLPPEFDWVIGCSFTGQPADVSPVRNLIGCNMSFRRDALARTGGFSAALGRVGKVPVGCEETELCIRMRRLHPDGVILYDPGARVHHRVTADRATWDYFRRRCFSEGRSKAVVARLAGTAAGLATEREYTGRTLPRGVRRELLASRGGDPAGLLRAGAILAGLAVTTGGYLQARARRVRDSGAAAAPGSAPAGRAEHKHRQPPSGSRPAPVRVACVELSEGVPPLPDTGGPDGRRYGAAQVLVRRNGQPLGLLHADLPPGGLSAQAHAELIEQRLGPAGAANGLPGAANGLPAAGWPVAAGQAPFVTVVVPTCGRPGVLRRCLDGLTRLDYPGTGYEVVVADNAPHLPGTAALVAGYAAGSADDRPEVRYAAEPRRGVAHARNRGLAEARGEIVAYADDDVVIDPGWLRALVDGFTDERVAAVTGYVLAGELDTPAQVWVEQYGSFGKGCLPRRFDATGYEVAEHGQVRRVGTGPGSLYPYLPGTYGSGASMAFRTEVLRGLGGFDHRLGSGAAVRAGEDIDVFLRLVLAGHALAYQPAAIVWHAHKRELAALRRTLFDYGVGLSAVMTKCLVTDPSGRRDLVRRLPRGVGYALLPGSAKNAGKRRGYPASLTFVELCGMALGPAYYARSAWTARATRHREPRR
ncbi:MAG TPA: glycosyltransferase [Micromonosporaceae bacterium]|nr:glycosyltransferase [Micromonosporaceae bacterium]